MLQLHVVLVLGIQVTDDPVVHSTVQRQHIHSQT